MSQLPTYTNIKKESFHINAKRKLMKYYYFVRNISNVERNEMDSNPQVFEAWFWTERHKIGI